MADNIKPEISLGVKGPQVMSLGDLLGTATKAMEFQRLSELYPELIKKTQAESAAAQFGVEEKRLNAITSGMTALINNPMVIAAEQDPNSVDPKKLLGYVTEHGFNQAKMLGIPEDKAQTLMAPYIKMATENPGGLRGYAKERLLAGLDTASRVSTLGGAPAIGVSTIPPGQPAFRGVRSQDMTAPLGVPVRSQDLMVAPVTENRADISSIPAVNQAQAQPQVPTQPQAPVQGGGITQPSANIPPLRYKPPIPGIPHAKLAGEDEALKFGQDFRGKLNGRALELTRSDENLDHVIRSATKLQESLGPTTGPVGVVKRKYAEIVGNPEYQQLKKDLAQAQQANLNALSVGGNSVAGLELNRDAMGDVTYAPEVLVEIARRTKADNTNLRLMHQGLDNHSRRFGDANTDRFVQMWSQNADSKIFQLMNINKDITDPKLRQAAAAKVLEGMSPQHCQILNDKYQKINRLVQTGDLAQ